MQDNFSEEETQTRHLFIVKIIKATEAASQYPRSDEKITEAARIAEKRFSHVETADFPELFDAGQKFGCATIDEFLDVWAAVLKERQAEVEWAARRKQAEADEARQKSPHPNRDNVFAQWGFV